MSLNFIFQVFFLSYLVLPEFYEPLVISYRDILRVMAVISPVISILAGLPHLMSQFVESSAKLPLYGAFHHLSLIILIPASMVAFRDNVADLVAYPFVEPVLIFNFTLWLVLFLITIPFAYNELVKDRLTILPAINDQLKIRILSMITKDDQIDLAQMAVMLGLDKVQLVEELTNYLSRKKSPPAYQLSGSLLKLKEPDFDIFANQLVMFIIYLSEELQSVSLESILYPNNIPSDEE